MKKLFLIILCCILTISMLGCNTSNNTSSTDSGESQDSSTSSEDLSTQNDLNISTDKNGNTIASEMIYYTFEDACAEATDVVVATFNGTGHYNYNYSRYSFTVKENILGSAPENINVYVWLETGGPSLERGKDYLIPLYHSANIYNKVEVYSFIGDTVIDVSDVSASTMYDQPISLRSESFDFSKADYAATLSYIKNLVKNNVPSRQFDPSPSVSTVISTAEEILSVRIDECTSTTIFKDFADTGMYNCTVTEALKGSIPKGTTVTIGFHNKDVAIGDEVIVALSDYHKATYYCLTGKTNSMFPVTDRESVITLIEKYG
ncbi:MAG: hypothetical protein IJX74_01465 [Clostridia bacterium]|nr:hypothetical protein [Clostridia bacterium]